MYSRCALLLIFALVLLAGSDGRPHDASDYEDDDVYSDDFRLITSRTLPPSSTTTTTSPRPHYTKYRVPGHGDCWKKGKPGSVFKYVKTPCYFCPWGTIVTSSGDCWTRGLGFRLLN